MAANYYKIISNLIQWKNRFNYIDDKKLQNLIAVLKKYEYKHEEDWEPPTSQEIAIELGITYQKVNIQLRKLYPLAIETFNDLPYKPKYRKLFMIIWIPVFEAWQMDKSRRDRMRKFSYHLDADLENIPRVGEEISIDFIALQDKFTYGYVHNIQHKFKANKHEILIEVHPFDNEYARWKKMEEEFDRKKVNERMRKLNGQTT